MITPTQGEHAQPEALRLADEYAAAHAKWALEDLYGTSKSYTSEKLAERHAARDRLAAEVAALTAAPQGGAYVENPAEIEHVAGDVSKNRAESNMTGGAVPAHHTDNAPLGYTSHEKSAWSFGYEEGYLASHGQAPAATVIKKGADRQWMSERLGHLPDGIYSLYLAPTAQPAPAATPQADGQPAIAKRAPILAYPPLPSEDGYWSGPAIRSEAQKYTADDMRAYVDADRAARSPADSVTTPAAGAVAGPVGYALAYPDGKPIFHFSGPNLRQSLAEAKEMSRLHLGSGEPIAVYAAAPTPAAQGDDTARLDWLDRQCEAYGFQDIHEGNRWEVRGAYANLRQAIDAERAALAQKEGKV